MLKKNNNGTIDVGVYHKSTSTERCVTSDSNCPIQHKRLAFHSYVHQLCKLFLSAIDIKKEYGYMKESRIWTVMKARWINSKWNMIIHHVNGMSPKQNSWRKFTTETIFFFVFSFLDIRSKQHEKLENQLGSAKDKTYNAHAHKYGIYSAQCDEIDYGQTRRNIETRFEHSASIKYNIYKALPLAVTALNSAHFNVTKRSISLMKHVNDSMRMRIESYYTQSNRVRLGSCFVLSYS